MYLNLQAVWVEYKLACDEAGLRAAAYNTFCTLWRKLAPHITVMKPMTDLCDEGEELSQVASGDGEGELEAPFCGQGARCALCWLLHSSIQPQSIATRKIN